MRGWDYDATDSHAFRWTQAGGMQDLTQLLATNGLDMAGVTLVAVTGISQNGQFILGQMTTPAPRGPRGHGGACS